MHCNSEGEKGKAKTSCVVGLGSKNNWSSITFALDVFILHAYTDYSPYYNVLYMYVYIIDLSVLLFISCLQISIIVVR